MKHAFAGLPILAVLLAGGSASSQEVHRTPDGSRFLLLPTVGEGLVHWAIASPAGPMEDPVGMEGLSWAVLVASLYGTDSIGTLDADRERAALDRIAALERATIADPSNHRLLMQLTAARMEAIGLRDPAAFRRVLAAAPATDVRIHQAPQAGLLELSTVAGGLGRVAELLHERREHNRLRALDLALAAIRAEEAARGDDPLRALRSEAVALAFAGHGYAEAAPRRMGDVRATRDAAQRAWQRTQQPARCLHVLTGGFDPDALRRILDRTFARTDLPEDASDVALPPRWPSSVRRATVSLQGVHAAVLALPAPEVDRVTLLWAADLLAGGDRSVFAEALRRRGRQRVTVRWTGPVPDGRPGSCLLVEVEDPEDADGLGDDCLAAIADAGERLRQRPPLEAVANRRRAETNAVTGDPRDLARWLAIHLLYSGDPAAEARQFTRLPPAGAVRSAALAAVEGVTPVVVECEGR